MAKLFDANRLRKNYPLIRVKPIYKQLLSSGQIEGLGVRVEVDVVDFANSASERYSFNETYTEIPVVALTPKDENVNIFITALTIDYVDIESSSEFTGQVHIQVYEDNT